MRNSPKFLLFLLLFSFLKITAQGDLMVMPKRVIFDGNDRSKEVNIANTGTDTATYAISFIQYKMAEDGNFIQIEEPEEGQRFTSDYLRYYPRRVSLAPNEAQTIRLQLSKTGEMTEGEYRSHLYFRAVEKQTALAKEDLQKEEDGISINIRTVFGISIPVIVRRGSTAAEVELKNLQLKVEESPLLSLDIFRSGNQSVYGNFTVTYKAKGQPEVVIGKVNGISVYTPNEKRHFIFPLQTVENIDFTKGSIEVHYEDPKAKASATATLELN
ncbi:molecular chaperone [Christiangramia flava]|uniref:Uncharacterized protein n=1 Tax=Christiangramia flava JLT2011 TaxID=1229726 RepID=A0A1L7I9S9_9FLAO|nr:molecular chaperone [Christiangramia flava]APU69974.1 hypothetical protein GRFL_3250 [Christiangramia flava JLT2011]OSS39459.1 hypothetical protein C723_1361 [Christiangramia flava JLT2011]